MQGEKRNTNQCSVKQKCNATCDYLQTVLTTESHKYILLQKVPHNNNRMTETCYILKQRSTELKGFKVHLMSIRHPFGGARMCPAQFEMCLMASVAAARLGLVLVVRLLSTIS